jgi:hypothetical protein
VVFLVILGSGFAVIIGYAIHRHFYNADVDSGNEFNSPSRSQEEYMRQVREQHRMYAWREAQGARRVPSRVT